MPERWPYRTIQELEDAIAHALALCVSLEEARRHARTPAEWDRLNAQGRHAEAIYDWLRDMRGQMRREPPER